MAGESVGEGRSVGFLPDYADKLGAIQGQYSHRFDEFTNPFLVASNQTKNVLPWEENEQANQINQGKLAIAQQQQQLAQTAQDTILPLTAQKLGVETSNLAGQGAAAAYMLNRAQTADASAPEFFQNFGTAIANGDKAGAYAAIAQNPEVTAKYSPQIQSGMSDLDKNSQIRQNWSYQSATQQGSDAAATAKFSDPQSYVSSLSPNPGESPIDFQLRQTAAQQGFSTTQTQMAAAKQKNDTALLIASTRAGAPVEAAKVRAYWNLIKSGQMTVDGVNSILPGLGGWAASHPDGEPYAASGSTTVNPIPSPFPEATQTETLKHFNVLQEAQKSGATVAPEELDQARRLAIAANPGLATALGNTAPTYDPVTSAQLGAIDARDVEAKKIITKAQNDPSLSNPVQPSFFTPWESPGPSPVDQAIETIKNNEIVRQQILKSKAQQIPSTPSISPTTPSPTINPGTVNTSQNQDQFSPKSTDSPQIASAKTWLQTHPDDPLAASVKQKILDASGQTSEKPKKSSVTRSFQVPATFGQ